MNKEIDVTGRTIKTERLTLRPFCQNDLYDFYEYAKVDCYSFIFYAREVP